MNSLFICNPSDQFAVIPGGVQICTAEFLEVIKSFSNHTHIFHVSITKKWLYRFLRKFKLDSYHLYDFSYYEQELINVIHTNKIDTVFINKAELIKVARLIKTHFKSNIKIVLMSHGNETGDFLHELTLPGQKINSLNLLLNKFRLGTNLYEESFNRHRFIDMVCAMSYEEVAIEKWLGAKHTFFFPRVIKPVIINWKPLISRFGFVGTLNHSPNFIAVDQICQELSAQKNTIQLIIVGAGTEQGNMLAQKYIFVKYLGALSDEDLKREVSSWLYFLNPIFWYSRGASMKLGQALGWGLPVISTKAGARGYEFKKEVLALCENNAKSVVEEILRLAFDVETAQNIHLKLKNIPDYAYNEIEISNKLKNEILNMQANE